MSRFFDEVDINRRSTQFLRELQAQPKSLLMNRFLSQIATEQSQEKTMYDHQAKSAAQSATTSRTTELVGAPVSALDMAVENVAQASRELMAAIHNLRQRLTSVAKPEQIHPQAVGAIVGANQCAQEAPVSPLVSELRERTRYLLAARDELNALNDRLEV